MHSRQKLLRLSVLLLAFAALIAGTSLLAYRLSLAMGLAELQVTGRHRLDLYASSLEREIDKYAYFSTTLGLERDVLQLLASPQPTLAGQVNRYLEQLNERAGTLAIYVLDAQGRVVASSNWRRPDSYLGEDLSFRPYFRQALETGGGRIFGIGTTRAISVWATQGVMPTDSRSGAPVSRWRASASSASQGTSWEVQICTCGVCPGSSSRVATRRITWGWPGRSASK